MTRPEPLPDIWYHRDLLVLREVARRVETGDDLDIDAVADSLAMDPDTVASAGERLEEDGYLADSIKVDIGVIRFHRVTAKGRREVGQWPSPEIAADRLVAALQAAVDDAPEGPEKTRRQKVMEAVTGMGREFIVGVATNMASGG